MKKLLLLTLIFIIMLPGCKPQQPEGEAPPKITSSSPIAEIYENNKNVNEENIDLIQFSSPASSQVSATIKTSEGDIEITLYPDLAPVAVSKFIENAESGLYKDTTFHKIMENFYIETTAKANLPERDENNKPVEPTKAPPTNPTPDSDAPDSKTSSDKISGDKAVGIEVSEDLWNFRGAIGMRDNLPDNPESDMTTFYIIQSLLIPEDTIAEMEKVGFPDKVINKYKEVGGIPSYDTNFTVFGQVTKGLDILDKITNVRVEKDYYPEEPIKIIDIEIDTSNYSKD